MANVDRWVAHTPMSDPGRHAAAIAALPAAVGALNEVIEGLLVHADWVGAYGLDAMKLDPTARMTLPVAERLDDILRRDPHPLHTRRAPDQRSIGTCRDFALMLCSFLRCGGIPARVRCGFAAYLSAGWEDHWVCEYWDGKIGTWRLSDPQIDAMLRQRNGVVFDTSDVPRRFFLSAGEAWLTCRHAGADPAAFGHGGVTGWWFLQVNVLRDHCALNGHETSAWDRWREAPHHQRLIIDEEAEFLDALAAHPEQVPSEMAPAWLERP